MVYVCNFGIGWDIFVCGLRQSEEIINKEYDIFYFGNFDVLAKGKFELI